VLDVCFRPVADVQRLNCAEPRSGLGLIELSRQTPVSRSRQVPEEFDFRRLPIAATVKKITLHHRKIIDTG
jgi:hypothetical protein